MKKIIITGGCGFIGSNLIRHLLKKESIEILNIDSLSYAGNIHSLKDLKSNLRYRFVKANICDHEKIKALFFDFKPQAVMHLAAESHVDRSISDPRVFLDTNVVGTFNLLESARDYYDSLNINQKKLFRFLHVSTDEVFGSLEETGSFKETTAYNPNSPYSASKAASDHLARAWCKTYNIPVLLTNCSNNFGPYQFPEKLIPLTILNALACKDIPVYGNGSNIREWIFVDDHVKALYLVLSKGRLGESYNIGGGLEITNIKLVRKICDILQELRPQKKSYSDFIQLVKDRPGHDFRYSIDASKIKKELSWQIEESFDFALKKTILWYIENPSWWQAILDGSYRQLSRTY